MRELSGIFLCLMGTLFAAPALLCWIYLTAVIPAFLTEQHLDPLAVAVILGSILVLGFFFTMGPLLLCLSHSMLRDESPFPSPRPILWFILRSLQFLILGTIIGACFGLFVILLAPHQGFVITLLSLLAAIPALILAYRRVRSEIDVLEH
jgi:hypothetical protein